MTNSSATESSSPTVVSKIMDQSSPYFLHPSDSPGMSLVNSTFEGKGYGGWRRFMLIAISAKNKLGFTNGSCKCPAASSPDLQSWNRCNDMVTNWLLNSLSRNIDDSVLYFKIAEELWNDLEIRFGQSNGAQLFHLQKEMIDFFQGPLNIAAYYTKIKGLWDELDTLNTKGIC
ncbi:hypothetical protein KY284_027185 [Solanum tuberosum]|nr:hypothetical protein KY284_027185 [Solanum tuberosum]